MKIINCAAFVAAIVGAAIGFAGPAAADPPNGAFNRVFTAAPAGIRTGPPGTVWELSPCGPDCVHIHQPAEPVWDLDLHAAGNAWTAVDGKKEVTIFKDSLAGTMKKLDGPEEADFQLSPA